jgi:hypothetical protein
LFYFLSLPPPKPWILIIFDYFCGSYYRERMSFFNFSGIIVGAATFLIIGICHPIVIKMEYYWGKNSWWLLLAVGLAFAAASIFIENDVLATVVGAAAFSCFWGILEMFEQEKRVLKGWFPENPARHDYYEAVRKLKKNN